MTIDSETSLHPMYMGQQIHQLYGDLDPLRAGPILSVFFALIVHSELKSVHPGFPVAFIF